MELEGSYLVHETTFLDTVHNITPCFFKSLVIITFPSLLSDLYSSFLLTAIHKLIANIKLNHIPFSPHISTQHSSGVCVCVCVSTHAYLPEWKTFLIWDDHQKIKCLLRQKYFPINFIHLIHKAYQITSTFINQSRYLHLQCHSTTYYCNVIQNVHLKLYLYLSDKLLSKHTGILETFTSRCFSNFIKPHGENGEMTHFARSWL